MLQLLCCAPKGITLRTLRSPPPPACGTWQGYMRMSLRQIAACDCLYMLPGWRSSRGARIEHGLALDLDLEVVDFHEVSC